MISFWILAAGLAALALVFVVPPLLRQHVVAAGTGQDDLNLRLFREQLAELDADLAAGNLDQAQYAAARHDLERELLSDIDDEHKPGRSASPGGRWIAAVLAVAVPAASIGLYLQLGETDIIPRLQTAADSGLGRGRVHSDTASELPPLDVLAERLAARMEQQPEDLEGWMMLGRTYFAVEQPDRALKAFERAYDLAPDNPEVLLAYAQGLASVDGGRLEGRPAKLIGRALERDPTNINARWLNGMVAYQGARYAEAAAAWESVLTHLDASGDEAKELQQFIAEARRRAGQGESSPTSDTADRLSESAATAASETGSSAPPAADEGAPGPRTGAVTVSVGLDESLWYEAAAEDALFVFAKAAEGPPMPLAVKRLQVKDLPATITLDDSLAMTPNLRLSSFPRVVVGARISKSGLATPQSGDLEGQAGPVSPGDDQVVTLTIDQERP